MYSRLSPSEIAAVAHEAGFRGNDLKIAVAVALAESSGRPGVNAVGAEDSRGLWQINSVHFGRYDESRLYEPQYNAKAAHDVYRDAGGFTPWTMYTNGRYRNHLDAADRAVKGKPWADGRGAGSSRHHGDRFAIRPWRLPRNTVGRAGRIVVDPEMLRRLARQLTGHLADVEAAYHRCRRHANELDVDNINVEHQRYERRLKDALEEALEDWHGIRRLSPLLANDVGYVVEARERALGADRDNRDARRSVEGLIATLRWPGGGYAKGTRKHVAELLRQLYRPDRHSRHLRHHVPTTPGNHHGNGSNHNGSGGGNPGRHRLSDVNVKGGWSGTKSVFEQFVTPFMRRHDLAAGSQKRNYDTVAGPGMSDHYVGSTRAYAIDYPTYSGEDEARALARAMGDNSWQPNSYDSFVVTVDGAKFRVQILWGAAIDHADHVHVGLSRL